jgi:hypothetical protein
VANLEQRVNVGGTTNPLYEVTVNDSDPNAEFGTYTFPIGANNLGNGGLSAANFETAVQAFADSLAESYPTFVLGSVKKISVSETTL